GGSGDDDGIGIALDSAGNVYVAGTTTSTNFPTVSALQGTFGGYQDNFLAKLVLDAVTNGPLTYTAPSGNGADNLVLRLHGTTLELLDYGTVVLSRPLANTTSVALTGAVNEPDSLTIDNAFGGLIQVAGG